MRLFARHVTATLVALILVLTAPALALSQTSIGASGVMVICTGTGPLSVAVDADGQPVGQAHVCPDCALAGLGAVLPDIGNVPVHASRVFNVAAPVSDIRGATRCPPHARARAPPCAAPRII